MPNILDLFGQRVDPLRTRRAGALESRAEYEVLVHATRAWVLVQRDMIDSQALRDALEAAFDEEVEFLDRGLSKVNGSLTKQELLVRKTDIQSRLNNRRALRTFS
jgi:hypothetical protein